MDMVMEDTGEAMEEDNIIMEVTTTILTNVVMANTDGVTTDIGTKNQKMRQTVVHVLEQHVVHVVFFRYAFVDSNNLFAISVIEQLKHALEDI